MNRFQNYPAVKHPDFLELLYDIRKSHPDAKILSERRSGAERTLSGKDFAEATLSLARALTEQGLYGKTVILFGKAGIAWVEACFAAILAGAILLPTEDGRHLSSADLILYSPDREAEVLAFPGIRKIRFDEFDGWIAKGQALSLDFPQKESGMPDLLIPSEGKTAMISQKMLCENLYAVSQMVQLSERDKIAVFLPPVTPEVMILSILFPLSAGACVRFSENAEDLFGELGRAMPTFLVLNAELLSRFSGRANKEKASFVDRMRAISLATKGVSRKSALLVRRRLSGKARERFGAQNMRLLIAVGESANPADLKSLREFGIDGLQSYAKAACGILSIDRDCARRDSAVGLPLPGSIPDITALREDGIGEIRVRNGQAMLGYLQDEEATAQDFRNGWFYTGDLGFLDRDGYLHLLGKKSDLILLPSGNYLLPEELESRFRKHSEIAEARVFEANGKISVELVPRENMLPEARIREIFEDVCTSVSPEKRPASFSVRKEPLPKLPSGRLKRG